MKKHSSRDNRFNFKAYGFLTPAFASILIFTILPIIYTVYISFTDYTMYKQGDINLVGFKNFVDVFNGPFKPIFFPVLGWTVVFATLSTLGTFLLGLILALLLNNSHMKEKNIYKAFLIIPWALPATIAVISWQGLLNGTYGAINNLLMSIHLISKPVPWLTDPFYARLALIIVNIWLGFPYMMNVCIGSIQSIPDVYYEAAEVDGAGRFTKFMKITLPSIAKTAYPLVISSFAFNFNNFSTAYLVTTGGPAREGTQFAGYTDILASVNYKLSINFGRYEIASAISIVIFIILAVLSYSQMKVSGQFEEVD